MLTSVRGLLAATLMAGSMLAAVPAYADETDPPSDITISGNVALVTDYRFRGLSQSAGDPAIQGTVNVNHSSGLYAGLWSSSIKFAAPALDVVYGNQELDLYAGWTGEVTSGVTADVGLLYYVYPGGHVGKANFFEPYASLSTTLGPVTAKAGVNYAWKQASLDFNADGQSDDSVYAYVDLSASIPDTPLSLSGHVGYADGALTPNFATGKTLAYKGGWDYNIGASFAVTKNVSIGATYIGVDGNSIHDYSNDTVVGTLKVTF